MTEPGLIPRVAIEAPAPVPSRFGLLDAALVEDSGDPHAAFGFEYEQAFCGASGLTPSLCQATGEMGAATTGRQVTVTGSGVPDDAFPLKVDWGDGTAV